MSKNKNMTADRAKNVLFCHNKWRRGDDDYAETDPVILGEAIDFAIQALSAPRVPDDLEDYDSGLLNDYGGGNVGWWQDYIRYEVGQANDWWRQQIHAENPRPPLEPVAPKGRNEYGLDVSYFHGKLRQIVRDCQRYTPDEMARSLARLVVVADESVLAENEFAQHGQQVIADLRAEVEALKAKIEELEAFRSAIVGWREWDYPEGFSRSTAEQLADHGKSRQMTTAARLREGGE